MDPRLAAWERRGSYLEVDGRRVFVWDRGEGPVVLALHGFPCSSHDWDVLALQLPGRRFVALDLPGFGLSDKDPRRDYSLRAQADVVERVATQLGISSCDVIAHDMGDSVATELLARANAKALGFDVGRVVLLNGSIFIDLANLTSGQRLFLKLPKRPLPFSLPLRVFRRQLRALFSREHPASEDHLDMLELMMRHASGDRLVPVTIRYIEERYEHAARWTAALVDFDGELTVLWGEQDGVAVPAMVDRLLQLRPSTRAIRWADVGHWPQLEVPDRVAAELEKALA